MPPPLHPSTSIDVRHDGAAFTRGVRTTPYLLYFFIREDSMHCIVRACPGACYLPIAVGRVRAAEVKVARVTILHIIILHKWSHPLFITIVVYLKTSFNNLWSF